MKPRTGIGIILVAVVLALLLESSEMTCAADGGEKTAPLTFGADDSGGVGAKLLLRRTDTVKTWEYNDVWAGTAYWGGTADGVWSSEEDSRNKLELGAEVGYVAIRSGMESTSEHLVTAAFSFSGRRGQFENDSNAMVQHDDYLYGPRLVYRFSWQALNDFLNDYAGDLGERPSIAAGYYWIGGANTEQAILPERIRANEYYAQFRCELPALPISKDPAKRSVMLSVIAQASKPVEGEDKAWAYFFDATLSLGTDGSWRPAITYRSGEKDGFKYDSQLIVGLTWDLFGRK